MRSKTRLSLRVLALAVPLWVSAAPAVCAAACANHDASSHLSTSAHPYLSGHPASDHRTHREASANFRGTHLAGGLSQPRPAPSGEPSHGVQTCRGDASDLLGSRPAQASAAPQLAAAVVQTLPSQLDPFGRDAPGAANRARSAFARVNAPLRC